MNLEIIKLQTTWNDAAAKINSNYAKIAEAIAQINANGGGGNGGGGGNIDLSDYATKIWVEAKGYITDSALIPYALKTEIPSLAGYALKTEIPTQLSQLTDDVGYALISQIPTNNNQLDNGAGYITGIDSSMVISALGYTPLSTTGTAANSNQLGGRTADQYMVSRFSPSHKDINQTLVVGIYRFDTLNNPPKLADGTVVGTNYGNLMVIRGGGQDTLTQIYFNWDNQATYIRSGNTSNTSNGLANRSWNEIAYRSHIPTTAAQIGALGATDTAVDSAKLGGQLPAYYATTASVQTLGNRVSKNEQNISTNSGNIETLNTNISNLKDKLDSMFEIDSNGYIKAKMSLYSDGAISAKGIGSGSGGGSGTSYSRLDSWTDYNADKATYVLSALLGNDLNTRLTNIEEDYATTTIITALEGRVVINEGQIATLKENTKDIDSIRVQSATNASNIAKNTTSITNLAKTIEGDEEILGDLSIAVSNLENAGYITAEALQPYAKTTDLSKFALKTEIPTNNNQLSNGAGYVTGTQLNSYGYATEAWVNSQLTNKIPTNNSQLTNGEGYIKGIDGAMVIEALNYTPFNAADFTKANIKNTLGIADWALGSTKPSYSWSEIQSRPTALSQFSNDVGYITASAKVSSAYSADESNKLLAQYLAKSDANTLGIGAVFGWVNKSTGASNIPTAGNLISFEDNSQCATQFLSKYDGTATYTRIKKQSDKTWSDWVQLAYKSHIPTRLSQLTDDMVAGHYLPLTGGSLYGSLSVPSITIGGITISVGTDGALQINGNMYATGSITAKKIG